jgi:hypothetical protein
MSKSLKVIVPSIIIIFGFGEIFVFDEEILILLCFTSFITFVILSLKSSIAASLAEKATSIKLELIRSFDAKAQCSQGLTSLNINKSLSSIVWIFTSRKITNLASSSLVMNLLNAGLYELTNTQLGFTLHQRYLIRILSIPNLTKLK